MSTAITTGSVEPVTITPALVSSPDAARYLGLQEGSLRQMRMRGEGPRYYKIGRAVRYRISDLDKWIDAQPTGGGK